MRDIEKLLKSLDQKLDNQKEEELELDKLMKAGVIQILNSLSKNEIVDSVSLSKRFAIAGDYARIFQSLFGIATKNISSGSFFILDTEKARALSASSSPEQNKQWSVVNDISSAKLNLYCSLVNQVSDRELNKRPAAVVGSVVVNRVDNRKGLSSDFSKP